MKRSSLLDMSLSVSNFLAQCMMIAIGNMDVKISEISSITINWLQLKLKLLVKGVPLLAKMIQIIKNSGIVIMGGFVKMEIVSAILSFFSSVSGVLFSVLMFFKPNNSFPPLSNHKIVLSLFPLSFLIIIFFLIIFKKRCRIDFS